MEEAYKEAISESLSKSPFIMPDEEQFRKLMTNISSSILKELNEKNRIGGKLHEWQVQPILDAYIRDHQRARYDLSCHDHNGRYLAGSCELSNIQVENEEAVTRRMYNDLFDNVSDFGKESNKFCHAVWGTWRDVGELIYKSEINPRKLVTFKDYKSFTTRDETVDVCSVGYIKLSNTIAQGYIHNPDQVEALQTSQFSLDVFLSSFPTAGIELPVNIPYIKCPTVKAKFRCEIEFQLKKGFVVRAWAKVLSLGINCAFDHQKTTKHTSHQFQITAELNQSQIRPREKPNINVSLAQAEDFLQAEATLREYKEQIEYDEDKLKIIKDVRDREIEDLCKPAPEERIFEEDDDLSDASTLSDDASDFSEISVDELMELSDSTASGLRDPEVKGNVSAIGSSNSDRQTLKTGENHLLSHAEQHLNTTRINSQNVANIETVSQAAYKAGRTVLEQKSAMFENAPNFNALTRGQKNAIGGFTFENLSDGRVRSNMGVNGKPTGLIEGDGKGFVQTRTGECQTPEYTDTTFVTKKGPKVTQYKYTNDADQMQMVTERFFNRWSRRDDATIKSPNLPSDFHLENMEVYGPPDAVDGRTFEVKTGPNSRKQIQPKGEINIDGVKTELPNVADVDKYLQENFTKLKDMASDVNVLRQERAKMAALEKQLQTKQTRLNKVRIKNPDQTQTIKALQSQIDDKIKGINKARKELKKQERAFEKESRKLKTTDDLAKNKAKRQMIKGAALQVAVGALIDGATTLIISISEQLELYKKGEITLLQLVGNVTKQTAVAVVRGGGVAAAMVGAQLGLQQMALASNSVISGIGKFGSTTLGPALLIGGLSFQTYGILSSYNQGAITTGEMQRQFGRMAATTGLSIGAMATSMAVFGGAGPAGLLIGAGCCIVVALGDYFFGDKFMRLFFDDDPKEIKIKQIQQCKEFEEKVINKAYELFGLEENCSDEELIEAKKAGYLKYHPDKCKGSEEEKRENTMKFQALLCAFTLLKVRRCMK